jgi:Cu(I)/Ag(I) efflux system membrane fusion protein
MIEILSPMSGTVVAREIYAGQYVKEGDKLFEIADFSTMWFRFDAYERDLAWLRVGQKVRVTTPSLPGRVFEAPIAFIDPSLNESTRSAKVRVELQNPVVEINGLKRREILNRAYAEATVEVSLPEVLAVPRGAVLNANGEPRVYVDLGGGAYAQRKVRLGRAGDEVWEVLEGLAEGERVVSSGNLLLDGQAQLNASIAPQAEPVSQALAPAAALSPAQESAVKSFLAAVDAVTRALASDNLEAFNKAAAKVPPVIGPLQEAFATDPAWRLSLDALRQSARLEAAPSLVDARKAFHPFSSAAAGIARLARRQPAFQGLHIFACPMTSRAYPGAPHDGIWVQSDAAVHNPFFGAEMLDCGTEVKP